MNANAGRNGNGNGYGYHNHRYGFEKRQAEAHPPDSHPQQADDEIDLRQLLSTLFRNKWIVLGSVLLFFAVSLGLARYITPVYKSEGTLLISESKNRYSYAGSDLSNLLTTTYGIGVGSTIANELQILQSRKMAWELSAQVMEKVAGEGIANYPLLWRDFPSDSSVVSRDTVASRIMKNFKVDLVAREADLVNISFESHSPYEAASMVNMAMNLYSRLSTEQNRSMASSALEFLDKERQRIESSLREDEELLRSYMKETGIVEISSQTESLIVSLAGLENERQSVKTQLASVESAVRNYGEQLEDIKSGFAEQLAGSLAPRLSRYQYQLAEYETEKMLYLANNPGLRSGVDAPAIRELDEKITLLREAIATETEKLFEEGNQRYLGMMGGMDGNAAQTVSGLFRELATLKVEQSRLSAQLEVLDSRIEELNGFFEKLPDNMIELARLKRDVRINEELFLTVSNQYAEMALWEQTQFGLGRPVDYGYLPSRPDFPNKPLFLTVGLLLGAIAGVGFVMARESFNDKVDSIDKLEATGQVVLAVIPDHTKVLAVAERGRDFFDLKGKTISAGLTTIWDTISPVSEAYRRLHNNIIFASPDKEYKSLLVTGSSKGEGKSTVVGNLAVVLAEAGKKVLVVDIDFRRPYVHRLFGENKTPGLTEYLFDSASLEDVIVPTVIENVDIITTGRRPPNPAALTQSRKLAELIRSMGEAYDHILLDTAPYGLIADAASIIPGVDGIVVVSRFNQTHMAELGITISGLKYIKGQLLGTVMTAFDWRMSSDGYRNSGYYRRSYADYYLYNE